MSASDIIIKNKRASFEYFILERYEAGIQLLGTEIKSIRAAKATISDAFCTFVGSDLHVFNLHIAEYSHGSFYNHEPKRDRKLLLSKRELKKISNKLKDQGITLIPLSLYINERGFAKLEIALAQGKKMHDKRESIKERDAKIEISKKLR